MAPGNDNLAPKPLAVMHWASAAILTGVALAGVLLWQPGYSSWALLASGLLLALTLFCIRGVLARENRVPANGFQWVLLGLGAIVTGHIVAGHLGISAETGLRGGVNTSMLFHFALGSLGVMLAGQFTTIKTRSIVTHIVAAVFLLGGLAALSRPTTTGQEMLWLVAAGGLCLWLAPSLRTLSRKLQWGQWAAAGLAGAWLLEFASIPTCGVALGCVATTWVLYALTRRHTHRAWSIAALGAITGGLVFAWTLLNPDAVPLSLVGKGERGFAFVFGGSDGGAILAATTGVLGFGIFIGGTLGCCAIQLRRARDVSHSALIQEAVWTAATLLMTASLLMPGGFVSPLPTIGLMMVWGLGRKHRAASMLPTRPGWILPAAACTLVFFTAISGDSGLMINAGIVYGLGDKPGHLFVGFVISLLMAWLASRKRGWLGLVALGVAALAGGAGELAQKFFSSRGVDLADWIAHLWGSAAALLVFGLSLVARGHARPRPNQRVGALRWATLGILLGGALAAAGSWGAELFRLRQERRQSDTPRLIVSDGLLTPLKDAVYLPGTTNSRAASLTMAVVTVQRDPLSIERGWSPTSLRHHRMYPRIVACAPGLNHVTFLGAPYSELAYERRPDARLFGTSRTQPILLVDARDLPDLPGRGTTPLSRHIQEITTAFVHPGPADAFDQQRGALRTLWPDVPCLCDVTYNSGAMQTARSVRMGLRCHGHPYPNIHLITSDPMLATAFRLQFSRALTASLLPTNAPRPKGTWLISSCSLKDALETYSKKRQTPSAQK
ncbi:MAG: hypothetical protein HN370_02625 [Phycisphaerales bacterium]|jgi:hypothetical protein|nr:hypothetical protein [Phycisphaerales bacterium]